MCLGVQAVGGIPDQKKKMVRVYKAAMEMVEVSQWLMLSIGTKLMANVIGTFYFTDEHLYQSLHR